MKFEGKRGTQRTQNITCYQERIPGTPYYCRHFSTELQANEIVVKGERWGHGTRKREALGRAKPWIILEDGLATFLRSNFCGLGSTLHCSYWPFIKVT